MTVWLASTLIFQLKDFCVVCVSMYVANFGLIPMMPLDFSFLKDLKGLSEACLGPGRHGREGGALLWCRAEVVPRVWCCCGCAHGLGRAHDLLPRRASSRDVPQPARGARGALFQGRFEDCARHEPKRGALSGKHILLQTVTASRWSQITHHKPCASLEDSPHVLRAFHPVQAHHDERSRRTGSSTAGFSTQG